MRQRRLAPEVLSTWQERQVRFLGDIQRETGLRGELLFRERDRRANPHINGLYDGSSIRRAIRPVYIKSLCEEIGIPSIPMDVDTPEFDVSWRAYVENKISKRQLHFSVPVRRGKGWDCRVKTELARLRVVMQKAAKALT